MDVDTRELHALARDLGKVPARTLPKVRAIVTKIGLEVKNELRAEAEGVEHAPRFPAAISYDIYGLAVEVGPEEGGAGSLALLYLGNSKTSPRLKDPMFAMTRQAAKADRYFEELAAETFR